MANDYDRLIETVDEEGNIVKFELIDIVLVDEDEYGILIPADSQNDGDNNEAVIMKLKKVDEDFVFEYIDDDAEFQKVVDAIEELEDDDDDIDDEE